MKYVIQFTFPNEKKKYLAPGGFDENPYRAYAHTLKNAQYICKDLNKEYADKNCIIEIVEIDESIDDRLKEILMKKDISFPIHDPFDEILYKIRNGYYDKEGNGLCPR